jgi:hypothetical protein|tara:strand:- start:424 stop:669 length:246 start_codon:yes stop_codon:yes gene_type:complete
MNTFFLTFGIFTIAMTAMAIGVIVNNRAIKGSCGGLNDIDGLEGACDICEIKQQCKRRRKMQRQALSQDATALDQQRSLTD